MKDLDMGLKILFGAIAIVFILGFSGNWYYKTVIKDRQNIKREIFENSNSFTRGKVQDAVKLYKEYNQSDSTGREAIENIVSMDFADFDEDLYVKDDVLRSWIKDCKR